jgi:hypothetical protein
VWYRCRKCNFDESRGCLPSASCGIYLAGLMGLWGGVAIPLIRHAMLPAKIPWWSWLLIVPGTLIVTVIGALLLKLLFETIEWLLFAARRCRRCGARRWSWGFTKGFGL